MTIQKSQIALYIQDIDKMNVPKSYIYDTYHRIRKQMIGLFGKKVNYAHQSFKTEKTVHEIEYTCLHEHILENYEFDGHYFFVATNEYKYSGVINDTKSTYFDSLNAKCTQSIEGVFKREIEVPQATYFRELLEFCEKAVMFAHENIDSMKCDIEGNKQKTFSMVKLIERAFLLYNAILEESSEFKDCVEFRSIEAISKEYFVFYYTSNPRCFELPIPNDLTHKIRKALKEYLFSNDYVLYYKGNKIEDVKELKLDFIQLITGMGLIINNSFGNYLNIDNILEVIPMPILMPFKPSIDTWLQLAKEISEQIKHHETEIERLKNNYLYAIESL